MDARWSRHTAVERALCPLFAPQAPKARLKYGRPTGTGVGRIWPIWREKVAVAKSFTSFTAAELGKEKHEQSFGCLFIYVTERRGAGTTIHLRDRAGSCILDD